MTNFKFWFWFTWFFFVAQASRVRTKKRKVSFVVFRGSEGRVELVCSSEDLWPVVLVTLSYCFFQIQFLMGFLVFHSPSLAKQLKILPFPWSLQDKVHIPESGIQNLWLRCYHTRPPPL